MLNTTSAFSFRLTQALRATVTFYNLNSIQHITKASSDHERAYSRVGGSRFRFVPELSCRMQGPGFTALGFGFSDLFHGLQGIDRIGMSGLR